ncbi:hypothetical protein [Pseudomonas guariconensis]|uniref:hypothetical protein n=1 Tax=Pseudomonas guariconensis TaxID=1288410 RepID=UPI0018AB621B|nr:hypothetical protein [Pseudomonas guariconensis]MBF8724047.1 hypothetical protein [Pseudomonas guariconensis]MBF8793332.1 hypothetical protein [Pseudomonas monteilii]
MYRKSLSVLVALLAPAVASAASCDVPLDLNQRQMINISDPLYSPANPHAGRMVKVDFGRERYELEVLGTDVKIQGKYEYRNIQRGLGQIDMTEQHPDGNATYSMTLQCLTDRSGMFIYTQQDGPVEPAQRQNSGRWTLMP